MIRICVLLDQKAKKYKKLSDKLIMDNTNLRAISKNRKLIKYFPSIMKFPKP